MSEASPWGPRFLLENTESIANAMCLKPKLFLFEIDLEYKEFLVKDTEYAATTRAQLFSLNHRGNEKTHHVSQHKNVT